jgi:hypothetical protein
MRRALHFVSRFHDMAMSEAMSAGASKTGSRRERGKKSDAYPTLSLAASLISDTSDVRNPQVNSKLSVISPYQ